MNPILYRYKDTESVIKVMGGYTPGDGWSPLYGSDEVKAATDAALEPSWQDPPAKPGYWCVVCGRFLPADEDGIIVHDNVPHPEITFDEEEKPQ